MKPPRRAFVLAAGFGTRMLPITRDLPKPMLPIWGVPALERVLRMLRSWGVDDVLVNLHHLPNEILQHILHRESDGLRIDLSFEPEILGTGGALPRASWFLDRNPFWMINADVACDVNPSALLKSFKPGRTIGAVWVHPERGPRTVEIEKGYVTNWRSGRPRSPGTCTFCGLHLLSPDILRYLPPEGMSSIITAYEKAMKDGFKVSAVAIPGSYWADIGTPAQYLEAHRDLASGRDAAVAATARVNRRAIVRDAVVMDGAVIGPHARVEHAVVGRNTRVTGDVTYLAMPADRALDGPEREAVLAIGKVPGELTAVALGPRGSARTFTRLEGDRFRAILIHYKPERTENTLYADHARFLRRIGVRVPSVLHDNPKTSVSIFEDLGDRSVQSVLPSLRPSDAKKLYERILADVLTFHERGAREAKKRRLKLVDPFRWKLYRWEHQLFAENMLRKRCKLPEERVGRILKDLETAARHLVRAPSVLVHRDLQSSNIILCDGKPAFIDFQGMRFGPAAYDLASLICDPYVELPPALREHLVTWYASRSASGDRVQDEFWYATIQRLGQALGAYGRLSANPDTASFGQYIAPGLTLLRGAVDRVPGLDALKSWTDEAEALLRLTL